MATSATVGVLRALLTAETAQFDAAFAKSGKAVQAWSADFTKFGLSTKQVAQTAMDSLTRSMSKVNSLTKEFQGANAAKSADEYAAAVKRAGGAAMLTAQHQAEVNAAVRKSLDHYKAVGLEGPKHLVALEQATRKITPAVVQSTSSLDKMWASLKGAAGLVGITFSVQAVTRFVGSLFDAASQVHDIALKLGVSAEAAQRFKFAAEQSGATVDDVSNAIAKMNLELSEGDKSTIKALQKAGLSFDAIRNMKPEDAFIAITEAIKGIEDPMLQAELAMKLFGKSGKELLPGIKEGFKDIGAAATVMSNQTVEELEHAQDVWEAFGNTVTVVSAGVLEQTIKTTRQATSSWKEFFQFVAEGLMFGGAAAANAANLRGMVANTLTDAEKTSVRLSASVGKASPETIAMLLDKPVEAIRKYLAEVAKVAPANKIKADSDDEAAKAAKRHADAIDDLREAFTGRKLQEQINDVAEAVGEMSAAERSAAANNLEFQERLEALVKAGGKLPPILEKIKKLMLPGAGKGDGSINVIGLPEFPKETIGILEDLPNFLDQARINAKALALPISNDLSILRNMGIAAKDIAIPPPALITFERLDEILLTVSDRFAFMGHIGTGAIGDIGKTLSNSIRMADDFAKSIRNLTSSTSALMSFGFAVDAFTFAISIMNRLLPIGSEAIRDLQKAIRELGAEPIEVVGGPQRRFNALQKQLEQLKKEAADQQFAKNAQGMKESILKERERAIEDVGGALQSVIDLSDTLPERMRGPIDRMVELGQVSAETRDRLFGLGDGPNWKDLQAKAEEFGVSLAALGPSFQQGKIADTALNIAKAFELLNQPGADTKQILHDMADEAQDVVTNALKFGVDVPEAMRPMLTQLQEMGELTDENGNLLHDLSRLHFSETITDGLDKIVDRLDLLLQGLGLIPSALDAITKKAGGIVSEMPTIQMPRQPIIYDGAQTKAIQSFDHRAMERVTSPGLAMVHPGDVVGVPPSFYGQGVPAQMIIKLGERVIGRRMLEVIPGMKLEVVGA